MQLRRDFDLELEEKMGLSFAIDLDADCLGFLLDVWVIEYSVPSLALYRRLWSAVQVFLWFPHRAGFRFTGLLKISVLPSKLLSPRCFFLKGTHFRWVMHVIYMRVSWPCFCCTASSTHTACRSLTSYTGSELSYSCRFLCV